MWLVIHQFYFVIVLVGALWICGVFPMVPAMLEEDFDGNVLETNQTSLFSKWSPWSRCIDCVQRRMQHCLSPKCHNSVIYEEKPCEKKRCKRKFRHKTDFNIIQKGQDNSHLTRQARSRLWSQWSKWSPCSPQCRTKRVRNCKKPRICKKKVQKQTAHCYYKNTICEIYVASLVQNAPNKKKKPHIKCGRPFTKSRMLKIIGGVDAKKDKWPWHVALKNQYNEAYCGGTLINPQWVLTANHCIRSVIYARLNEHDLNFFDGREREFKIKRIFSHPGFNKKTVEHDIALLMLPSVVNLPVACLPNKPPTDSKLCYIVGWGKKHTSDDYGTDILQEATVPIVGMDTCKSSYFLYLITNNMLCAGWGSGKSDTCAGDSGGGLMCPTQKKSKTYYSVQGITSFGDGCGLKNRYGIYTNVFNYRVWIIYIIDHYSG